MAYTHEHRFLKKHGLPYYVRLTIPIIAQLTGISESELQSVGIGDTEKKRIVAILKYIASK